MKILILKLKLYNLVFFNIIKKFRTFVQTFFNSPKSSKGSSNFLAMISVFLCSGVIKKSSANSRLWWANDGISSGIIFLWDWGDVYLFP